MRTLSRKDFTADEQKVIQAAASATWDYIGGDTLQCVADSEEKDVNDVAIPRSHVIEMVLDANRIDDFIKDKALLEKMERTDYKVLQAIVKPAFPFARYGM